MHWRVGLEGYRVMARHGYFDHEHQVDQPFVFTVWVSFDRSGPITELEDSINYADVQAAIDAVVLEASTPIRLLEDMAQRIIERLNEPPFVSGVTVRIEKPEAPLPHPGGLPVVEAVWTAA